MSDYLIVHMIGHARLLLPSPGSLSSSMQSTVHGVEPASKVLPARKGLFLSRTWSFRPSCFVLHWSSSEAGL